MVKLLYHGGQYEGEVCPLPTKKKGLNTLCHGYEHECGVMIWSTGKPTVECMPTVGQSHQSSGPCTKWRGRTNSSCPPERNRGRSKFPSNLKIPVQNKSNCAHKIRLEQTQSKSTSNIFNHHKFAKQYGQAQKSKIIKQKRQCTTVAKKEKQSIILSKEMEVVTWIPGTCHWWSLQNEGTIL